VRDRPSAYPYARASSVVPCDLNWNNQHVNTLCVVQYWGVSLISVSDRLDIREEHAKVAYQFRGIINELYLTDLKKKTHRGQMGQVLRGFSVGSRGLPVGQGMTQALSTQVAMSQALSTQVAMTRAMSTQVATIAVTTINVCALPANETSAGRT
jgi:hypothetical protein